MRTCQRPANGIGTSGVATRTTGPSRSSTPAPRRLFGPGQILRFARDQACSRLLLAPEAFEPASCFDRFGFGPHRASDDGLAPARQPHQVLRLLIELGEAEGDAAPDVVGATGHDDRLALHQGRPLAIVENGAPIAELI